ncbi:MAG: KH domain-containing protein [Desulfovibrio sp.]|uniref:R3H domain-containing nucleic acid-binding protein n=1 Tax=Desulfovibrio sp. TaxID=885 RepID=UPI001A725B69|nr:R3H domain-containing nucleic acid-binding protein [Desulfovibrio sp.]MBD5417999.1 KH domain-containing protein [Desulfovibrio sp.]
MDGFKEFQGKDLDSAIAEACAYFDSPRERLEIEIVQDAKTGIFGIVGARKAKVRARRVQLREAVESVLGPRGGQRGATSEEEGRAPRGQAKKPRGERRPPKAETNDAPETQPAEKAAPAPEAARAEPQPEEQAPQAHHAAEEPASPSPARPAGRPQPRRAAASRAAPRTAPPEEASEESPAPASVPHASSVTHTSHAAPAPDLDADDAPEGLPRTPLEELDAEHLQSLTEETVKELVRPITGGRVPVTVRVEDGRVRANVDWSGEAGLLIGREGQTLAALQYLASRMVSHGMNAAVRVQLDIGDYRLRQDEKLRAVALSLAEKARATGRPYSTRPLSSYHRRIIHLALQDADDLQTRSSGDGPLKRVVISRRRPEGA